MSEEWLDAPSNKTAIQDRMGEQCLDLSFGTGHPRKEPLQLSDIYGNPIHIQWIAREKRTLIRQKKSIHLKSRDERILLNHRIEKIDGESALYIHPVHAKKTMIDKLSQNVGSHYPRGIGSQIDKLNPAVV
jgi:hypothetical protein